MTGSAAPAHVTVNTKATASGRQRERRFPEEPCLNFIVASLLGLAGVMPAEGRRCTAQPFVASVVRSQASRFSL